MKINTLTSLCLLLGFSSLASFASSIELNSGGSKEQPIELNLATNSKIKLNSENGEKIHLKVTGMLPQRKSLYQIKFDESKLHPDVFTIPNTSTTAGAIETSSTKKLTEATPPCDQGIDKFKKITQNILKLTKESELPEKLEAINSLLHSPEYQECNELKNAAEALVSLTTQDYSFVVKKNTEHTLSVSYKDSELGNLTVSEPATEWLMHTGITFLSDKNQYYYSKKITPDEMATDSDAVMPVSTYRVARGEDRSGMDYAATVMFTYPVAKRLWSTDIDLGLSAGIGADKNTIASLFGVSLIINQNFVLTFGAIGTQFDVLKGEYKVGDDLGETPIDSSNLMRKTYKFSPMATMSFKFGD